MVKLRRVKEIKKKKKTTGKRLMDFMRFICVDCDFYVIEWWKELRKKKWLCLGATWNREAA